MRSMGRRLVCVDEGWTVDTVGQKKSINIASDKFRMPCTTLMRESLTLVYDEFFMNT